jgi:hypothetical protein
MWGGDAELAVGDVVEPVGFRVVDAEFAAEEVFPPAVVERLQVHVAWGDEVTESVF